MRWRQRLAWGVLIAGILTTLGTSAPANPTVAASGSVVLEPGERVHVVVRASRAAVRHADWAEIDWPRGPDLDVVPDGATDGVTAPLTLGDPLDACPGEGDCDIGLDVENIAPTPRTVSIRASFTRLGDGRFLFPEDRSFPHDSTVAVLFE